MTERRPRNLVIVIAPAWLGLAAVVLSAACSLFTTVDDLSRGELADAQAREVGSSEVGPSDAATDEDATPPALRMRCGSSQCAPGTESCCLYSGSSTRCMPVGKCDGGVEAPCLSRQDCESRGQSAFVCCGFQNINASLVRVECVPPSTCADQTVLCDQLHSSPCTDGRTCEGYTNVPFPGGYCR